MSADLDIFFKSSYDPLFYLEYHRQFTHSLLFIPIGSLICSIVFYFLFLQKKDITFKQIYFYSTLGYATHCFLDSSTTYGTQLFWPFTNDRVAWNIISIIDPLFTLPLLLLVLFAAIRQKKLLSHLALTWIFIYISFGLIQRERAEVVGAELAKSRGHNFISVVAKPSFANLIVRKIIYETSENYYIDAVKLGFEKKIIEGLEIDKLNVKHSFPWLDEKSQQAKDIERFRWFSNGYIALSKINPNQIIDIRYSTLPNKGDGLWGIELNPTAEKDEHIKMVTNRRSRSKTYKKLWNIIIN